MTICIVDTSILDELLNVPGWANHYPEIVEMWNQRRLDGEAFLLPVAALIETGNHVAQVTDGVRRRKTAELFRHFARNALGGQTPFSATPLPSAPEIEAWLDDFPDCAMRGIGLADRSLIALWERHRTMHRSRRVYIWSLDSHLASYDTDE